MPAASRHGTPSLTSLPKDGGVSCFGRCSFILKVAHPGSDRTQELAGSLGHSHPVEVAKKCQNLAKISI